MEPLSYYSNGKLLLTGEYFVLEGAKALALPLKLGQSLEVFTVKNNEGVAFWNTFVNGNLWFQVIMYTNNFEIRATSDVDKAKYLINLWKAAQELANTKDDPTVTLFINCNLTFQPEWGFGSSSSLISNMANWFEVDPYSLLWRVSEGSGYDIACARTYGPIIYQLDNKIPEVETVNFRPSFSENIYFIYLGNKQISEKSIWANKELIAKSKHVCSEISQLTAEIVQAGSLSDFNHLIERHEQLVARTLKLERVKKLHFQDSPGEVKSLGAWGGDCVLATHPGTENEARKYFNNKGFYTIFTYNQLVL